MEKKEVALIIIFNHRFDKNIDILEKIYRNRFSNIYHIIPFYDGDRPNVIPVYENSYCFQGYIAQGLKNYFSEKYSHYFFVADDLILNPEINENNFKEHLSLGEDTSYLPYFKTLHEVPVSKFWQWTRVAYEFRKNIVGVETSKELPSYDDALKSFNNY